MTASKSSRARNARAAARGGTAKGSPTSRGGTAVKDGSTVKAGNAVKTESTVKDGNAVQAGSTVKDGNAVKDRNTVKAGNAVKDRNAVKGRNAVKAGNGSGSRNGAAQRVSRGRAVQEDLADAAPKSGPALWMQLTTFALALAGLGVSVYLTIAHFTESTLAGCAETKGVINCAKVTTSPQSYVFGIPVAVLGLAFYVFAAAIMSPWAWRAARREIHLLRIASLVVGIGFVVYLLYAELFIIGSICLYCTSVHVITLVLFVLTVIAAAAWGLVPRRQPG